MDVVVVEDRERRPVLRIVVRPGLLVVVEGLHDLGRQRRPQAQRLGDPFVDAGERRRQHEAGQPAVAAERVLQGEHSAPRGAEEVHAHEPELVAERGELVHEDRDAPIDGLRTVGAAAADLVVEDDGASLVGELLQRGEVVVRRAGAAVETEERVATVGALPDDGVPRAVAARLHVASAALGRHATSITPRMPSPASTAETAGCPRSTAIHGNVTKVIRYRARPVSCIGGGPDTRFSTESGAGSIPES